MTLISRTTLTTSAASVTFSSIPQTFQTLKLLCSTRGTNINVFDSVYFQFNNPTPNYSSTDAQWRLVQGSGSAASSASGTNANNGITSGLNSTSNTFGSMTIDIPNYAASTAHPLSTDSVGENNATETYQRLLAGLWTSSAAITSITLFPASTYVFVSGSTFSLYGVS